MFLNPLPRFKRKFNSNLSDFYENPVFEYVHILRTMWLNPIVEMGLFIDADGIPISTCIVPGNQSEQTTAIPLEEKLIKMLKRKKFIYCADAGLEFYHIREFNSMGGKAFIVKFS